MTNINFHQPGEPDIALPFPTEWNDLLTPELEAISKHLLTDYNNTAAARAGIFLDLLLIRSRHHQVALPEKFAERLDSEAVVMDIFPVLDYIFSENDLTKQPYRLIKLPGLPRPFVYGPHDDFNSLTCGEYEDAEVFFLQFQEDPGPEPLAHLASVLFRPKGKPYIRYQYRKGKYITYNAEKLYKKFLQLSPYVLHTIYTWYTGCRNQLPKYFPVPFEGSKTSSAPDYAAFTKCIHAGAGPKNGTRDQIRSTSLKEFFFDMNLEAQKAKDLKEAYEKQR